MKDYIAFKKKGVIYEIPKPIHVCALLPGVHCNVLLQLLKAFCFSLPPSLSGGPGGKGEAGEPMDDFGERNENDEGQGERGGNGDKPTKKSKNGKTGTISIIMHTHYIHVVVI